jgi:RNA polymerase sigma-70 factor (ECF subfamily)
MMQTWSESFEALEQFMVIERSDQEWVAQLQDAEPSIQHQAFLDLGRYLHRVLLNYLRSRRASLPRLRELDDLELEELARGFAQEALQVIWEKLPTYIGRGRFTSWAATIAVRTAGYELRKPYWRESRMPQPAHHNSESDSDEWSNPAPAWPGAQELTPETQAHVAEILHLIETTIQQDLSDRQRFAFVAQFIEERSSDEIADELGITRNAVYMLIHEARKKIRRRLLEAGHTPEEVLEVFQ